MKQLKAGRDENYLLKALVGGLIYVRLPCADGKASAAIAGRVHLMQECRGKVASALALYVRALKRTQPTLAAWPGLRVEGIAHDRLFAILDSTSGEVISQYQVFSRFLHSIDANVPKALDICHEQ